MSLKVTYMARVPHWFPQLNAHEGRPDLSETRAPLESEA